MSFLSHVQPEACPPTKYYHLSSFGPLLRLVRPIGVLCLPRNLVCFRVLTRGVDCRSCLFGPADVPFPKPTGEGRWRQAPDISQRLLRSLTCRACLPRNGMRQLACPRSQTRRRVRPKPSHRSPAAASLVGVWGRVGVRVYGAAG